MTCRDFGNGYTREPEESYLSPPFKINKNTPNIIHWDAEVPTPTKLIFQLRSASTKEKLIDTPWRGPNGTGSYYEKSGQKISGIDPVDAEWFQYKATLVSPNGCKSPSLREVRFDLNTLSNHKQKNLLPQDDGKII